MGEPKPISSGQVDLSFYDKGEYKDIPDRRITADVCKKFGVRTDEAGNIMFPGYKDGQLVAVKTYIPTPKGERKKFKVTGPWSECDLFGLHAFPKTGPSITVTEGEFDAMAAYRMTGSKYPHASILNGCNGARKDFENSYDKLNAFGTVVVNFDADEPGRKATEDVGPMFPGKVKTFQVVDAGDGGDACDYLKMNKSSQYVNEFHRAKTFTLGGLVNMRDSLEAYREKKNVKSIAFPEDWKQINQKTYGVRLGEIVLFTAGTGTGKTQVLRELKYHWLMNNPESRILDISLEESLGDSAGGLMALHANKRITLPDVHISEEEEDEIHSQLFSDGRMIALDHEGSFEDSSLLDKINYAATVDKCNLVFLDHITIAVSDGAPGQENFTMDSFMNRLLKLVKRLNICVIVVSHLRKTGGGGKSFEEGRVPCEDDLKGSGSLKQIAFTTIALSRNKYAESDKERNTTSFHVLKCRFTGRTGPCDHAYFDDDTGRMTVIDPETFFDEGPTGFEPVGSAAI